MFLRPQSSWKQLMKQGTLHKVLTFVLLGMIASVMQSASKDVLAETGAVMGTRNVDEKIATLNSAEVVLTETNERLNTGGKLTISDGDRQDIFVTQKKAGRYGTFNIDASGAWTYVAKTALNELKEGQIVSDKFVVSSADGTTTSVRVVINNGTNTPAVLGSADVVLTEGKAPLRAHGKLTIKDVDSPETFVPQRNVAGHYGTFNIDKTGAWTYVTKSALNELKEGERVSDSFIVSSADGTTTTVKVTIVGVNTPAVLGSADVVLTEGSEPLRTGGTLTIKDVDSPETFVPQSNVAGHYGTFNIDKTGAWTYVTKSALNELKEGERVSDSFTVSSADGTTTTVKVTIKGVNTPAVLGSADVVLTEGSEPLRTGGTLTIKDVDSPETFVPQRNVAGKYGTFNIDKTGAWTYVTKSALNELKEGERVSDSFIVSSADGTTTTVKVTIVGVNTPAVLGSADVVLTEGSEPLKTHGKLTIKDVDSPETFVPQSNVAGKYGTFNIDKTGAWTYVTKSALNELKEGERVNDSFTVSSADGTTTTVKITIIGVNTPAVLGSADVVLMETSEPLRTRGKLTIKDVDSPETFVPQSNVVGKYGTFNIDASGAWTYVANSAFEYLNVGQSVSDSFTVSSADGTTTTVKVTIRGVNTPAILSSADVVLDETNEPLRTGGKLTIKDVDSPETFVPQSNVAGKYGTFNIDASGAWTYVANSAFDELNVGQSISDTFTVSSADGTTTTVKVTINGTNDPAILSSADVALDETDVPLRTNGKLTISDVDSPETFVAQSKVAGTYGTFNIDESGAWTYVANSAFEYLNVGQSISDTFTVSSADGTTTTVKVTIRGVNTPAILGSADVVLDETNDPLSTGGKLTIRDVDSPETFVPQRNVAGTNGTFNLDESGAWTYVTNSALDELNVGRSASDVFTVSSADGTTTTVRVTINGTNDPAILSSADIVMDETNDPLTARGKLTISDVDDPETFVEQNNVAVANGIFNIDSSGAWTYVANDAFDYLNEGDYLSGTIPVTSADGTTTTIKITINGTNDPAILSSADVALDETNEPLRTSGRLSIRDVDSAQTFVAQSNVPGANGIFNIDASGVWSYVANSAFDYLNVGDKLSDTFIVCSADGTTTTVKITINGTNDPAILSSANINLDEIDVPQSAKGKLTIKDVDNPEIFVEQKDFVGTTGTFNLDKSGAWTYLAKTNFEELKKGQSVSDNFVVTSSDGTHTAVKITIHGTEPSEFRGRYLGGSMGINRSGTTGTTPETTVPNATTLAYGLQGGYMQFGYNWDLKAVVAGIGGYLDWNDYTVHSNQIAYSSRSVGLNAKVGLPIGDLLPYVKLGYGYNVLPADYLPSVRQWRPNYAAGIEYNFISRWSATAEYKQDNFSSRDDSIQIRTKIFSFGLTYYFDIPRVKKEALEVAPEAEIVIPEASIAPEALPEAPPPP